MRCLARVFPISSPIRSLRRRRRAGKLIFAALAGLLAYLIRTQGSYPDGVAFSVLILNIAGPFIDQYTQPAVFGRKRRRA